MMTFIINLVLLSSWTALVFALPHNAFDKILKGPRGEFESSGNRPHEPIQGIVKVLELDPALTLKGFLRSGQAPRRSPSLGSRLSYPAFLSQRHPGPALTPRTLATPLNHLQTKTPTETELKKRQGLQMWQRAINKGGMIAVSLPVNLKETKQTCTPMPFTQRVTAVGCDTVTVHNKLCFGQCSSLFVPSEMEFAGLDAGTGALHHHRQYQTPCSRCVPSLAHTVVVPLHCGLQLRHKQVMIVEECKCETSHEDKSAEATASAHL